MSCGDEYYDRVSVDVYIAKCSPNSCINGSTSNEDGCPYSFRASNPFIIIADETAGHCDAQGSVKITTFDNNSVATTETFDLSVTRGGETTKIVYAGTPNDCSKWEKGEISFSPISSKCAKKPLKWIK